MKWDYKVVSIDKLFNETGDHDIAISKEAAASRRAKHGNGVEATLKELGEDSWELVSITGEFGIFKKPLNIPNK